MKIATQNDLEIKKPYTFKSTPHWWEEKNSEAASHTNVLLVVVMPDTCFYFRQESLIEYDRKKMRVWGRWRLQILPNNREDASDQPVSPSCTCYLISFIFLINFTGMKVCGGRREGGGLLINLALTVKGSELPQTAMSPQTVLAWIQMNPWMDNRLFVNAVLHFSPWNTYNYCMNSRLLWDLLL